MWRQKRGCWLHQRPAAKAAVKYSEVRKSADRTAFSRTDETPWLLQSRLTLPAPHVCRVVVPGHHCCCRCLLLVCGRRVIARVCTHTPYASVTQVNLPRGATDTQLASILSEDGVRVCIQFDPVAESSAGGSGGGSGGSAADVWRLGKVAPGVKGVQVLKTALRTSSSQESQESEAKGDSGEVATATAAAAAEAADAAAKKKNAKGTKQHQLSLVCCFVVGRKRVPIDFGKQLLGFRRGCVILRPAVAAAGKAGRQRK